jgi:hypothetical protein
MSRPHPASPEGEIEHYQNTSFCFENFWVQIEGFMEAVQQIWNKLVHSTLPLK